VNCSKNGASPSMRGPDETKRYISETISNNTCHIISDSSFLHHLYVHPEERNPSKYKGEYLIKGANRLWIKRILTF